MSNVSIFPQADSSAAKATGMQHAHGMVVDSQSVGIEEAIKRAAHNLALDAADSGTTEFEVELLGFLQEAFGMLGLREAKYF